MQPNRLGRVLGISARVAAEKLRERTASVGAAPAGGAPRPGPTASSPRVNPASRARVSASAAAYADGGRRFARGAKRFGGSLFRPFAHATGVLTLQISGVFFAMFTLFFIEHAWQIYGAHGWNDHHLPVYAGFALLFAWFTVSSFWRARRKQKQR